jgi:hypothetical protein
MKYFFSCLLVLVSALPVWAGELEDKQVNVLVIMTDQQRFDALSAAGNAVRRPVPAS